MSSDVVLDAKRLASFKTSLLNLRAAMRQRQMSQKPDDADAYAYAGGSSADVLDATASSQQEQQQQQQQQTPSYQSHTHTDLSSSPRAAGSIGENSTDAGPNPKSDITTNNEFLSWIHSERECFLRILFCAILGAILGFVIGTGWLASFFGRFLGYGSFYQYMVPENPILRAMSTKTAAAHGKRAVVRYFVISAWRVRLAKTIRGALLFQLLTLKKTPWRIVVDLYYTSQNPRWKVASSPLWPTNWLLFREVDLSQVDVGDLGFSPVVVTCLSLILPWHRNLIRSLAVKEKIKVDLRYSDGTINEPSFMSESSPTPFFSSIFPSKQSNQPINPFNHPMAFHALREHIIRFENGFVHPDLGFLIPAPSGAERGIGMIRDTYTKCQVHCIPGTAEEKLHHQKLMQTRLEQSELQDRIDEELMEEMMKEFPGIMTSPSSSTSSSLSSGSRSIPSHLHNHYFDADEPPDPIRNTATFAGIQAAVQLQQSLFSHSPYSQSEILLRIPIEAQMTRKVALDTLMGLLPLEQTGRQSHMEDLDDGFVLAVYLAHERGMGVKSRIWPYIATLPLRPTCALNWGWRQSIVDVVTALSMEMGTDVQGWPKEISKAADMFEMIVLSLSRLFGDLLASRPGAEDVTENIRWALCQVASRAIAGRESHGSLRLVPIMDMINHDAAADKFMELSGAEKLEDGHILNADETDAGTFIVRSRRHGVRKPLKRGQELMANYNVPNYSPLDWFLNMGYVPPERTGTWTMLEPALPRSYRGGFSGISGTTPGVRAQHSHSS